MRSSHAGDEGVARSTATDEAVERYLGKPKHERSGMALCLSGGGYRATLFDLGAMRRLDELGILSRVTTFSSVSGGSIAAGFVAAHLVERLGGMWPSAGERIPDFEQGIAKRIREMAGSNVRTAPALARFNPLNLRNSNAASDRLAAIYEQMVTSARINQMPSGPGFVFCATDLTFRCGWEVDSRKKRAGNDTSGWLSTTDPYWSVGRAIAASSCFPGVFPPMEVDVRAASGAGKDPDGIPGRGTASSIGVTDGGVFDNLGLEPVWQDHAVILVADAAPSFGPSPNLGPIWPSIRPIVALLEQATVVRKRWLISNFIRGDLDGAYWGIASLPTNYGGAVEGTIYPNDLIENLISQVRIELDAFSPAEMGILENHGYLMCDLAIRKHLPTLPSIDAPLVPPHDDLMDRATVERALKSSHKYKLLGRGGWR